MNILRRLFGQSGDQTKPLGENENGIPPAVASETEVDTTDENKAAPPVIDEASTRPLTEHMESAQIALEGATRPLNEDDAPPSTNLNKNIVFAQTTDIGMMRSNNQDSVLSFFFSLRSADNHPDFGIFIVADGMGGHHDGEKASAIAARTVAEQVTSKVYLPMIGDRDNDVDRPSITEAMVDAVQYANQHVVNNVPDGGTTLTVAAVVRDLAYIAHVGDSRVYLITPNSIEQITRDHSYVQRLIELDQLPPEEAEDHPQKNVLYRALGQNDALEVDALTRRLPGGSRLLLCSDGLWGQVRDSEIAKIVREHANPQKACDALVALANTRGGIDNVTAIVLQMPGSSE